jgi:hypothetical protein
MLYAKGHSAQPDMFWRTHHTKPDPKSMRVILLCNRISRKRIQFLKNLNENYEKGF